MADHDFLTASQAAVFIGVSRSTVRRAVAHGVLSGWHTPGKHLRIARATCLDFARSLGRVDLTGRPSSDPPSATEVATATSGTPGAGYVTPLSPRAASIALENRSSD
jgi:excisionase family DNA binding protein